MAVKKFKTVLAIAGSDSGAGAGIQADLKTISACGGYGTTAITALTAQNTLGVFDIHPIPAKHLKSQIEAVLDDIGTDAVKIGMLHNAETIHTVVDALTKYQTPNIVVDPVMVATSGDTLLRMDAITALKSNLLPLAKLITPNIPECALLLNTTITETSDLKELAKKLGKFYKTSVLLKAGHLNHNFLIDVLYNNENNTLIELPSKKVITQNTHGTGCTLSAAIATYLAKGNSLEEAVKEGKLYLEQAIIHSTDHTLGKGHGPLHHFYKFW
ncbi:bifunctional hydroxymethylpyrimidine kinase/phosphomethylpyrimidine kinase [Cellulophaga sp. HaHa_2_95]|uniref:bifunctional hydroxymethylpyrimidine kinase/phosphomethylpyrimidine kinase n=1 Tax=Cellulophaga sp. HaHa_2_95 TaxID=2745558 RepID=UPI001C4FE822|nr:bifunctional hydroxymethylpyrimidine kinase/phosphomethylpyrimidine kinase [Cellulophaga sp. HaHa_2_95]QXP56821.1 bifunctional hydroxymethylpyrimidine kinase/phosphomethylpyrimidine kinase [Cellulophaga sp. HaHa_2_95]